MTGKKGNSPESIVREIKRQTRRKFTAEEKIRIVLEGLRGEAGIADLCRKEGIHPTMYYKWSKAFLEAPARDNSTAIPFGRRALMRSRSSGRRTTL
jgi:transposase